MIPMSVLTPLSPAEVSHRLKQNAAVLIDIREPDEFCLLYTSPSPRDS